MLAAAALVLCLGLVYLAWPSRKSPTSPERLAVLVDPKSPQKRPNSADALLEHDRRIAKANSDCVTTKDLDLMIRSCTDVIAAGRADASIYHRRGFAYNEKLDYGRAIPDHDKAIELDPNNWSAYMNRGNAMHRHLKDYQRAIADYNRAIQINPSAREIYYNRATTYSSLKDWPQALADLDKTISLDARFHFAFMQRAFIHNSLGRYEQAIADANQAIELAPGLDGAFYQRGFAHEKRRNRTQAVADYRRAAEINPSNKSALDALQRLTGTR